MQFNKKTGLKNILFIGVAVAAVGGFIYMWKKKIMLFNPLTGMFK